MRTCEQQQNLHSALPSLKVLVNLSPSLFDTLFVVCLDGLPLDLSTALVLEVEILGKPVCIKCLVETRTLSTMFCAAFKISGS